ncbi:MAG: ROK family protein [Planctomycetota bacterium]|nr:ROK family protein [Planctomycetota bacterium]
MKQKDLYIAVDMGATKVQASTVLACGTIVRRLKNVTPRDVGAEPIVEVIENSIHGILEKTKADMDQVAAVGLAIPGVVDPDAGRVVFTANAGLSGFDIGPHLHEKLKVPVVIGNDCNLGALGEKWLGSARDADSAMAVLVGTGIGGGFVQGSKLWRGARESASEIGHTVMQIGGPKCGCGNLGCFEALASRTAIERDIRQAIDAGRASLVTELTEGNLKLIRSGVLSKALEQGDELVAEVLSTAAEIIGHACISVRHLLDPEVIVLGGGVIEACSDFMVPIVERIVAADNLPGARPGGGILVSSLGDDAVVLGAVALARLAIGENPFKKQSVVNPTRDDLTIDGSTVCCGDKKYKRDFYITVNGKCKALKPPLVETKKRKIELGPDDLTKACEGGPATIFIGTGMSGKGDSTDVALSRRAVLYLAQRKIDVEVLSTSKAVKAYNACDGRKAALIRVEP